MTYTLTLTGDQAQALWQCIQHAPLPRQMTDDLARTFREQVEAANRQAEAAAKAGANGHDQAAPQ